MPFDLVSQPWLPCRGRDGTRVTLGIGPLFERAHELECLDDPSPLVTLALHRLLLAILHRVLGPSSLAAWKTLYVAGRFPTKPVLSYLEEQRAGFDLLHPARPFYQTRGLPREYEADGIGRLVLERSNYGAPSLLFQHRSAEATSRDVLSFAEAARSLVALHAFAPSGTVNKPGEPTSASAGPLRRGAYVLVRGTSLFETLLFNLVVYDPENNRPIAGDASKDCPSWEQPPLARPTRAPEPKRLPYGYVDWLTWQSRRVELALSPEKSAVVGVVYCVAQGVEHPGPQDPMLAFRIGKEGGPIPIGLSESRSLWRDCHAFVREAAADGATPPAAVAQLATRQLADVLQNAERSLVVSGMRGEEARIYISRTERLVIPAPVLVDNELKARLSEASAAVEDIATTLNQALRIAAEKALSPDRDPAPEEVSRLVKAMGAERGYWAALAAPFGTFLEALPRGPMDALQEFTATARSVAGGALRSACEALGGGARHLKALACAEAYLARQFSSATSQGGSS